MPSRRDSMQGVRALNDRKGCDHPREQVEGVEEELTKTGGTQFAYLAAEPGSLVEARAEFQIVGRCSLPDWFQCLNSDIESIS